MELNSNHRSNYPTSNAAEINPRDRRDSETIKTTEITNKTKCNSHTSGGRVKTTEDESYHDLKA